MAKTLKMVDPKGNLVNAPPGDVKKLRKAGFVTEKEWAAAKKDPRDGGCLYCGQDAYCVCPEGPARTAKESKARETRSTCDRLRIGAEKVTKPVYVSVRLPYDAAVDVEAVLARASGCAYCSADDAQEAKHIKKTRDLLNAAILAVGEMP